jgi:hypothetical protein
MEVETVRGAWDRVATGGPLECSYLGDDDGRPGKQAALFNLSIHEKEKETIERQAHMKKPNFPCFMCYLLLCELTCLEVAVSPRKYLSKLSKSNLLTKDCCFNTPPIVRRYC